jgi:Protein of Unknown function (DUF2784)
MSVVVSRDTATSSCENFSYFCNGVSRIVGPRLRRNDILTVLEECADSRALLQQNAPVSDCYIFSEGGSLARWSTLTTFEMWLRAKARATTYAGSFVEYWLQRILYYEAPAWVFALLYSLFGLGVVATWWYFPPRFSRRAHESDA